MDYLKIIKSNLSNAAKKALEENETTLEQMAEPANSYTADLIEDYLSDSLLMFEDFPLDSKVYIEIALAALKLRRKYDKGK